MGDIELLVDLHLDGPRQGPGGDDETRRAIDLSGLRGAHGLEIADIGCGTGASTLVLAQELNAHILAVDLFSECLRRLEADALLHGVDDHITTLAASMDDLPVAEGSFDAIWSEGAIYIIGFERGVREWRRLLKPGGILAVSDLTWLSSERPAELDQHWTHEYAEVATASSKFAVLEANGYSPVGYFALSERCWLDHYYRPLQQRFAGFLARHGHSDAARRMVDAARDEISLYERSSSFVSYGYFVAERTDE